MDCLQSQDPCVHPWMHAGIHLSMHPSISPSIHASIHTSIHAFIHPCLYPYIHSSIYASIDLCIQPSIHTLVYPSIHPIDIFIEHLLWGLVLWSDEQNICSSCLQGVCNLERDTDLKKKKQLQMNIQNCKRWEAQWNSNQSTLREWKEMGFSWNESVSRSVVSDSLWLHGLYSP